MVERGGISRNERSGGVSPPTAQHGLEARATLGGNITQRHEEHEVVCKNVARASSPCLSLRLRVSVVNFCRLSLATFPEYALSLFSLHSFASVMPSLLEIL